MQLTCTDHKLATATYSAIAPVYLSAIHHNHFYTLNKPSPLNLLSMQKDAFLLKKSARLVNINYAKVM